MISAWRFLASRLLLVPLMTKFISETSLWQGIVAWNRCWQMKGMSFRQHFEDIEDILDTKDTKTQGFNWALDKIDTTGWVPGHQEGVLGLWKHPRLPQRKHYDQLAMTGSLQKCKYEFHRCEKHNIQYMMTYLSLKNIHRVWSFWSNELSFTFLFLSILVFSWIHLSGNVLIEISKYFNNGRNVVKYFLTRLILRQSPESAGNSLIRAATAATVCHSAATPFLRPFSRQPHQDDFCF